MLLQTHERMTAKELSRMLEVSQRTIYRDVYALNTAGIPVYTDRGPGGGIALVESYRTTLTGISEDEARALFMLSIPKALVDLGVGQNLKTALYKLAVAMPHVQQSTITETQQRIYLDTTGWTSEQEPIAHLSVIHQAIWQDRLLRIIIKGRFNTRIEILIAPLGLVSKLNSWYLMGMADGHMRVLVLKDIMEVSVLEQDFTREESFNLMDEWLVWCREHKENHSIFPVLLKVSPELCNWLGIYLHEGVKYEMNRLEPGADDEWRVVKIEFDNFSQARECILSMGGAAEVIEPEALKRSVVDFAQQIINFYQGKSG
jgi:predicted DNA-binding transcriptional regulator YafY